MKQNFCNTNEIDQKEIIYKVGNFEIVDGLVNGDEYFVGCRWNDPNGPGMPFNSWMRLPEKAFLKKGVMMFNDSSEWLHTHPDVGGTENFKLIEIIFRSREDFRVARGLDRNGDIRTAIQWWNFPTIDYCPYWVYLPNSLKVLRPQGYKNECIIMSDKGWTNDVFVDK